MPVSAESSGTQTASVSTEHTLLDVSSAGIFSFEVDKINMAAGDVLELRIYKIILTAGTRRVCYFQRFAGAQPTDDMIAVSVPIANELTDSGSLRFTLKQTKGTGRDFYWKVLRY